MKEAPPVAVLVLLVPVAEGHLDARGYETRVKLGWVQRHQGREVALPR